MQATRFLSFKKKRISKWLAFLEHPLRLVQEKESTEQGHWPPLHSPSAGSEGVSVQEAAAGLPGRGEKP